MKTLLALIVGVPVLVIIGSNLDGNHTATTSQPYVQPVAAPAYDRDKAAAAYWKAACDVAYGHADRSDAGAVATRYLKELGIDPAQAYADPSVTTTAEMLDRKAGTNCFG